MTDPSGRSRQRAVQRVLWVTLGLNACVAVAKILYGYSADALSIRADGFHSLTDSSNNLVGLVAVAFASRPADSGHPYGYQKMEAAAAGLVGLSLLAMALDVVRGAVERLLAGGAAPRIGSGGVVLLVITLLVNWAVARYERQRGTALQSAFLLSDSAHTRSDVIVTVGVLLTAIAVGQGLVLLDALAALGIAAIIGWTGVGVLRRNLSELADAAVLDPEAVSRVVVQVPGVASTHKIRTRGTPFAIYLDLHIQVAPQLDVVQAHRVTHAVIDAVKRGFPAVVDVVIHTEPARPGQPYTPLTGERQSPSPPEPT